MFPSTNLHPYFSYTLRYYFLCCWESKKSSSAIYYQPQQSGSIYLIDTGIPSISQSLHCNPRSSIDVYQAAKTDRHRTKSSVRCEVVIRWANLLPNLRSSSNVSISHSWVCKLTAAENAMMKSYLREDTPPTSPPCHSKHFAYHAARSMHERMMTCVSSGHCADSFTFLSSTACDLVHYCRTYQRFRSSYSQNHSPI